MLVAHVGYWPSGWENVCGALEGGAFRRRSHENNNPCNLSRELELETTSSLAALILPYLSFTSPPTLLTYPLCRHWGQRSSLRALTTTQNQSYSKCEYCQNPACLEVGSWESYLVVQGRDPNIASPRRGGSGYRWSGSWSVSRSRALCLYGTPCEVVKTIRPLALWVVSVSVKLQQLLLRVRSF